MELFNLIELANFAIFYALLILMDQERVEFDIFLTQIDLMWKPFQWLALILSTGEQLAWNEPEQMFGGKKTN